MKQADIYLVSSFADEQVKRMGLRPFANAAEAVAAALHQAGAGATVAIMPHGGATVPRIIEG